VDGRKEYILFPQTYDLISSAQSEGIPAIDVWTTIKQSVNQNPNMRPSTAAAAIATYYGYVLDIYKLESKDLPL
jgi:hypothetical protein